MESRVINTHLWAPFQFLSVKQSDLDVIKDLLISVGVASFESGAWTEGGEAFLVFDQASA